VVRSGSVSTGFSATGSISARELISVSASTGGLAIKDVLFDEGDAVVAGQTLVRLDRAQLAAQIVQQQAVIESREASLGSAETQAARASVLLQSNATSRQSAEERQTAVATAKADLQQANASLVQLEVQLTLTDIAAPVSGTIVARSARVGAVPQIGSELFQIVRDDKLDVKVDVPQIYIAALRQGQTVDVFAGTPSSEPGTIRLISQKVDPQTRLGSVYVSLPKNSDLRIGMYARVHFEITQEQVITVPETALVWRKGDPAVFLLGSDKSASLRSIEIAGRSDGRLAVKTGLAVGETVVSKGAAFLNDGASIEVFETPQASDGVAK
jgi:RND family efflux transporter MFP subunit